MDRQRLEELAAAHLDGALTPEEATELAGMLRQDAEARRWFILLADQETALHDQARLVSDQQADLKFADGIQRFAVKNGRAKRAKSSRRERLEAREERRRMGVARPWLLPLLAACVLTGVTLYLTVFQGDRSGPEAVGKILWVRELTKGEFAPVLVRNVDGREETAELKAGQALLPGDRLKTGGRASDAAPRAHAALVMNDGAQLDLAGGTELQLPDHQDEPVKLEDGFIFVEAPESFSIACSMASVSVPTISTRFTLLARKDATRLQVEEGEATLATTSGGVAVKTLEQRVVRAGGKVSGAIAIQKEQVWRGREGRRALYLADFHTGMPEDMGFRISAASASEPPPDSGLPELSLHDGKALLKWTQSPIDWTHGHFDLGGKVPVGREGLVGSVEYKQSQLTPNFAFGFTASIAVEGQDGFYLRFLSRGRKAQLDSGSDTKVLWSQAVLPAEPHRVAWVVGKDFYALQWDGKEVFRSGLGGTAKDVQFRLTGSLRTDRVPAELHIGRVEIVPLEGE